ncbi:MULTISPECIES: MarR family transcriptional regulator [unclassified Streptomyces]|uniref:MarR family transcriptional regulator n=1 Tax=unclassified Streptomyces TaxID=2593676 RepID=UPI003D7323B5
MLSEQLGPAAQQASGPTVGKRKVTRVSVEFGDDASTVHDMVGPLGYSLASNWFTQRLAQLLIANKITRSQLCVFLYMAGGQTRNTGVAEYTQKEITDGLNKLIAEDPNARKISRPTVNRAIRRLCEIGWVEQVGNGRTRLNVRLWFHGGSAFQHEVLADMEKDLAPGESRTDHFPYRIGPDEIHQHQEQLDLGIDIEQTESPARRPRRTG